MRGGRQWCIRERFSEEFGQAFGLADEAGVLEVFAPGEAPIPGASGQVMASNVPLPAEHVVFEPSWSAVPAHLADRARPGDIVMTLGAGDISMMGPEVLALLERRERDARNQDVDRGPVPSPPPTPPTNRGA